MQGFHIILYMLFFSATGLHLQSFASPLPAPLFVAALVPPSPTTPARTLASFEMTTMLRLTPEIASGRSLDSQMKMQFQKLHRLMPHRAAKMQAEWNALAENLDRIFFDLSSPPDTKWNEWVKPKDETIAPVGAVAFFIDGKTSFYLDKNIFPRLNTFDQTQVIWQMLWSQELRSDDNMAIRTLTNYLLSREWREIEIPASLPLLQKLKLNYYESQGFCFAFNPLQKFYPNGLIQGGFASEECLVNYQGQTVRLSGLLDLDENGNINSYFHTSTETPWTIYWEGQVLNFHIVNLYPNGQLKEGYPQNWIEKFCANTQGPFSVKTAYAEITAECVGSIAFYSNGILERISNAEAWVILQGQRIKVGNQHPNPISGVPDITFFENGSLKRATIPQGTRLETINGTIVELNKSSTVIFNPDGKMVSFY